MPAPHRQALALAFFEIAAAHDGPPGIADEHPSACFDLVIEIHRAGKLANSVKHPHLPIEPARVDVFAAARLAAAWLEGQSLHNPPSR
jgi:hypothetical protein